MHCAGRSGDRGYRGAERDGVQSLRSGQRRRFMRTLHAMIRRRKLAAWRGALGDALRGVRGVRGMPGVRLGARGLNTVKSSHEAEKLRRTPAKSG